MNALKKVFRPGSAWVRVNHRFPDREGGRILAPAGTPVRCQVERVHSDSVAFKLERGTTSYLSWPQPPLQVKVSPDTVEISDDHGALLTYTKAPPLSEPLPVSPEADWLDEAAAVTMADFLNNGFMLMKSNGRWYTVFWAGERVGSVLMPSWSNVRRATAWLNTANQKRPFDRSKTNFFHWVEDLVNEKVMPKFPILPPGVKVAESAADDITPEEIASKVGTDVEKWARHERDWHYYWKPSAYPRVTMKMALAPHPAIGIEIEDLPYPYNRGQVYDSGLFQTKSTDRDDFLRRAYAASKQMEREFTQMAPFKLSAKDQYRLAMSALYAAFDLPLRQGRYQESDDDAGIDPAAFTKDYFESTPFDLVQDYGNPGKSSLITYNGEVQTSEWVRDVDRPAYRRMLNWINLRHPFNPKREQFFRWWDYVSHVLKLPQQWEKNNLREAEEPKFPYMDPGIFISNYMNNLFQLRNSPAGFGHSENSKVFFAGMEVDEIPVTAAGRQSYEDMLNYCHKRMPFNPKAKPFYMWFQDVTDKGLRQEWRRQAGVFHEAQDDDILKSVVRQAMLNNPSNFMTEHPKSGPFGWWSWKRPLLQIHVKMEPNTISFCYAPQGPWARFEGMSRCTHIMARNKTAYMQRLYDGLKRVDGILDRAKGDGGDYDYSLFQEIMNYFKLHIESTPMNESEDIDPAEIATASPGTWMHRHSLHWWVWESDRRQKVRIWVQVDPNKDYMCWTVMCHKHNSGNARVFKKDIPQGQFMTAIKRACDKVAEYVSKHPKTACGTRGYNFAVDAIANELKHVQHYRPAYTSDTPENALEREATAKFWAESIVDKLLESEVKQAAIRLKDGRIFTGPIHCMAVSVMQDQGVLSPEEEDLDGELQALGAEFGWLDEQGRFLTRRQAYKLAVASGQIADVYGPHKGLTHDMLDDEDTVHNIPEGMTFSGSMPMWTMPERIVKRLLQEEDDIDFDPADVATGSPETWMQRIPQDGEDEGKPWRWWSWTPKAPNSALSISIYTNPESGHYSVTIREAHNLAADKRIDIRHTQAIPVTYRGFLEAVREATREIEANLETAQDPKKVWWLADPLGQAEKVFRKKLHAMLVRGCQESDANLDPNEFLTDFVQNRWSCRFKTNMFGTGETWFYYGDLLQGYDSMPRGMSHWYVEMLNYLTKRVGFKPNPDRNMPAALTDPRNVIHKWMDDWAHIVVPWMESHPVPGAHQPNLPPQEPQQESDDAAAFFHQWRDNPWRYDFGQETDTQKQLKVYFRGNLVRSHWVRSDAEAEQFMDTVKKLHEKLPFEGGSFIVWLINKKNVPKTTASGVVPRGWHQA